MINVVGKHVNAVTQKGGYMAVIYHVIMWHVARWTIRQLHPYSLSYDMQCARNTQFSLHPARNMYV